MGWGGACDGTGPCVVELSEARTVTATFERTSLTLQVIGTASGVIREPALGLQCSTNCSAPLDNGTLVTLTATPDGDGQFDGWSGDCAGTGPCELTVLGPRSVTATFRPPAEPVSNYQSATLVLGQQGFSGFAQNLGGESLASMSGPRACASDGTRLWVADADNARVLQWDAPPTQNFEAARLVLGQASATSSVFDQASQTLISDRSSGLFTYGPGVGSVDSENSRILIWDPIPTVASAPASAVIGQPTFGAQTPATTASAFDNPYSARVQSGYLFVADTLNHRVLIYNTVPVGSGRFAADVVLGQSSFTSATALSPPNAASMNRPFDVFYDPVSDRLFVADTFNHRVLVWVGVPATSAPADYVLGQASSTSNAAVTPPTASTMRSPRGVLVAHGSLFVADADNNRVLVWTPVPTSGSPEGAPAPPATRVLGQPDLTTGVGQPVDDASLVPWGMCVSGRALYVVDNLRNRVLRFDLSP